MSTVKYFHSAMTGAPTLTGNAGSLIAVLDACLVNGFALKTADSVVVAGNIATTNFSTGHSFEPDTIALIEGATPAGLNGQKRVLTTTTNTITFATTGISDQTATGTITAKLAPAGWEKLFSGTNLGAYRSLDLLSSRCVLRVDDTVGRNARVLGYESMSDVNTGLRRFPVEAQVAGGGWWPKADATTAASARAWTLIADGKMFYIHMHGASSSAGASGGVWGFGDFKSFRSGDQFNCVLHHANIDISTGTSINTGHVEAIINTPTVDCSLPRPFNAIGGSVRAACVSEGYVSSGSQNASGGGSGNAITPSYPNVANNALILHEKLIVEPSVCLRGRTRGILLTSQGCHSLFSWRDKIDGQGPYLGRKLLAVKCGSVGNTASQGVVFFDITGPWA